MICLHLFIGTVKTDTSGGIKKKSDESVVTKSDTESKDEVKTLQQRRRGGDELQKHYHNINGILQYSNATPIRAQKGIGYLCCFCNGQYPNPADLKEHNLTSHEGVTNASFTSKTDLNAYYVKLDITGLYCKLCNDPLVSLDSLYEHLTNVHKKLIYRDVKNHVIPFKFDSESLRCFICLAKFSKFKLLLAHMAIHMRNFVCDTCNAGFVNRKQLSNHSKTHDTGIFNCDRCYKVFDTLQRKRSHMKSVHTLNTLLNKCGHCNEGFKLYTQKVKHLKTVHGITDEYKCAACDKTFWNPNSYRIHIQRDHLLERRHCCTQCEMKFYNKTLLKDHMLKHTGMRKYKCDVCYKSYGRRSTLREHLRIHADDRRYKCEHCGQAFVQKCSWRGHMRTKHGEDV